MSAASKRVRATAERLFGPDIGCADGGCLFGHSGGMQTNGGCQCLKEARHGPPQSSVTMNRLAKLALALAEEKSP